jgi:pSer/pThr/pTyr-binding forkhead associated (FHA) protein
MHSWYERPASKETEYRIRVGNEEIELAIGATMIGRDSGCRITIFDPMISRRHARIQFDGAQAAIEDLGSRNGTRVNNVLISGPHTLRDGDRVGIGSQEMVVSVVDASSGNWATDTPTGLLSVCSACRLTYPEGPPQCPHCGAKAIDLERDRAERERRRSDPNETKRERWSLGMLIEMVGRAILTERAQDAERILREAAIIANDRIREGAPIEEDELRALDEAAAWLDKAQGTNSWSTWITRVRDQMAGGDRTP